MVYLNFMNNSTKSCISLPIELSLTTFPFLLLLSAAKSVGTNVESLGKMGEEIFRGERLPLLSFPESSKTTTPESL
jgi:hypothetical protein